MKQELRVSFDKLPPSVNNYLRPSVKERGGRHYVHMYETQEAKDFKKLFGEKLRREVKRQKWDIEHTKIDQWYCDVIFIQTRTNADSHNYYKILLDSMEGIVFDNDKNVQVRTPRVFIGSSENQGFQLKVSSTNNIGLFNNEMSYNSQLSLCKSCRYYRDGGCSVLKAIKESRLKEEFDLAEQKCKKYTEKKAK
ncbi:RusA family crossover junction endodeoxyribonuclease [Enterococcus mundtii]|uniref:RusA family crossover junction endodeoxyribonuclease n=1 Tax=Enterococcus mundtii TaxID=53346 RepID=UPI001A9599CA|nr:RusA family crossover junction endodeoxyribonuclease [Enterococcus mundtii]MBO1087211.1 RusA family crossover junction endodeoxyribonuclease [Enterococcus mundtii]